MSELLGISSEADATQSGPEERPTPPLRGQGTGPRSPAPGAGASSTSDHLAPGPLVRRLGDAVESWSAGEILEWALDRWGSRLAICTSFQITGAAIVDMAWRIDPSVRVVTLDTGRLPVETYEFIEQIRERYGIEVEVEFPDAGPVREMVRHDGPNLFYDSVEARRRCCRIRKVEPLRRALAGFDAWVAGLRRDQSPSRASTPKIEIDEDNGGLVKINPLADWTADEVWDYVNEERVPYHPLYDRGYTSIGCAPCTRPVKPGESRRAGRWWWESPEEKKECGLHVPEHGAVAARGNGGGQGRQGGSCE